MGTRSMIGCLLEGGTFGAVYCHWDGYLEHNGLRLHTHWPTIQCARTLYAHGGMSSLGTELGQKHDFNTSNEGAARDWCTFYARDRGEPVDDMRSAYATAADLMGGFYSGEFNAEYCYLHSGHEWMLVEDDYKARPLREVLEEEGIVAPRIVARQRRRTHQPRAINWGD